MSRVPVPLFTLRRIPRGRVTTDAIIRCQFRSWAPTPLPLRRPLLITSLSVKWWKHAFAVEPPGVAEPNDVQRGVVEKLCLEVTRRGMTTPALLMLEMSRPLNYVSAQFLESDRAAKPNAAD